MKKKETLRVCKICKKKFDINSVDYLKDNGYMELECYKQKQLNKGLTIDIINEKIEIIHKKMNLEIEGKKNKEIENEKKKLKSKEKEINRNKDRDMFVKWVQDNYNITILPKLFFIKIAGVNSGTYKGLKEGILYDDLLYMFKTKKTQLDKYINKRKSQGAKFDDGLKRFYYDLAVIVNNYDSYKKWKEKQQILKVESDNLKQELHTEINYKKINKVNNESNVENNDIDDIIDELF